MEILHVYFAESNILGTSLLSRVTKQIQITNNILQIKYCSTERLRTVCDMYVRKFNLGCSELKILSISILYQQLTEFSSHPTHANANYCNFS